MSALDHARGLSDAASTIEYSVAGAQLEQLLASCAIARGHLEQLSADAAQAALIAGVTPERVAILLNVPLDVVKG